jgi:hypothetical protein
MMTTIIRQAEAALNALRRHLALRSYHALPSVCLCLSWNSRSC